MWAEHYCPVLDRTIYLNGSFLGFFSISYFNLNRDIKKQKERCTEMKNSKWGILVVLLAFGIILSACGGDTYGGSAGALQSIEDVTNDHVVGVALGTSYEPVAREHTENVSTYESDVTALRDLATSENLDAVITDRLVGLIAIEETGFEIEMAGDLIFEEKVAVPVQKGNQVLLDKINEALAAIYSDGTYEEISNRYFGTDIGAGSVPDDVLNQADASAAETDFLIEDGVFTFAMSGEYRPFNYIDEATGELVGFDVEIGKAIADYHGWEANPVQTPWSGILSGLKSGKFDAIIGSMGINPERAEQVDFSHPYYLSGAQLFVRP
jgi:ABC-type amino acid transport substrate-binding protein